MDLRGAERGCAKQAEEVDYHDTVRVPVQLWVRASANVLPTAAVAFGAPAVMVPCTAHACGIQRCPLTPCFCGGVPDFVDHVTHEHALVLSTMLSNV